MVGRVARGTKSYEKHLKLKSISVIQIDLQLENYFLSGGANSPEQQRARQTKGCNYGLKFLEHILKLFQNGMFWEEKTWFNFFLEKPWAQVSILDVNLAGYHAWAQAVHLWMCHS